MTQTAQSMPTAGVVPPAAREAATSSYDAFISYKRADIAFARALEKALNAFTPPKSLTGVPQRRLRVFRDEGDLTGTEYFAAIEGHLRRSSKLIVICSPSARSSIFVDDEIRRFVGHHGAQDLVPVLLAGVPNNEATEAQAADMAFPDALVAALAMPLAVSYREFDPDREKVDRGRFEGSWYTLLANLYGCSRDEIEQRDRVRRRRRRNLLIAIGSAVAISLSALAAVAYWQKLQADAQRNVALRGLARYLASVADTVRAREPQGALLLAVESVRTTREIDGTVTVESANALRRALAAAGGQPVGGRGGRVRAATFSDDGKRLVTVEDDGRIDLWDLARPLLPQTPLNTLPGSTGAADRRVSALSADGRWLAIREPGVEGPVLWDSREPGTAAVRLGSRLGSGATTLDFSPDSRWLATTDADARIHLTALDDLNGSPRMLVGHRPKRGSRGEPMGVSRHAFDPRSRWLYTTAWEGSAQMWDLAAPGRAPQSLEGTSILGKAHFSQDGHWFATPLDDAYGGRAPAIGLWRLEGQRWKQVEVGLPGSDAERPPRDLSIVGFTAPPLHLVASFGGRVHLWSLDNGTPVRTVIGRAAVLDRDGRRLALIVPTAGAAAGPARPETVRIVDVGSGAGEERALPELGAAVADLRFDFGGRRLGVVTSEGRTRVAVLDAEDVVWKPYGGADTAGDSVHFGHDGHWLFGQAKWGDFSVRAWPIDSPSAEPVIVDAGASDELEYKTRSGGGGGTPKGGLPHAVAIDPKGRWLSIPGRKGTALLIDLADPAAPPRTLEGHARRVTAAVFGPGGDWLATGDWNHGLRIWRPAAPDQPSVELTSPRSENESSISAIAVSPDGRFIATGGASGVVALRRLDAPNPTPRMLQAHKGWITDLAFSLDGRLLSAGDDGKLAVWSVDKPATEAPLWSVDAHRGGVLQARFLDEGRRVVSAGADALLRVWTTDAAKAAPTTLRGHEEDVSSFVVDDAGRALLSGGLDGTVRLWDLAASDRPPLTVGDRRAPVNAVAMSRDGRWIAAADGSADVRLWDRSQPADAPQRLPIDIGGEGGRSGAPWGLRFTDDGRWLLAIAAGRLHRWRVGVEEQLELACRLAGRNLAHAVWQTHLDRIPYRLTCPAAGVHPAWMRTADELAKKGQTVQAVVMYEVARRLEPELRLDPARRAAELGFEAHLEYARNRARTGEGDAALALYATAHAIDPTRKLDPKAEVERLGKAQALEREAIHKGRSGDVATAAARFREAQALDPQIKVDPEREARRLAAPTLQERGDALARDGNFEDAIALYEQAIAYGIESSLEPRPRAADIRAHALVAQAGRVGEDGDLDGATRMFAEALELKPALGYDPVAEGRKSVAKHRAEQASRQVLEGRIAEAAATYREARLFDPQLRVSAWDMNELCWQATKRNVASAVLEFCDLAVAASPDEARIRDSRAIARTLVGDRAGAIDDLQATIDAGNGSGMERGDLDARRRLLDRLRAGARFGTFEQLQTVGIRP